MAEIRPEFSVSEMITECFDHCARGFAICKGDEAVEETSCLDDSQGVVSQT